MKEIQEFTFRDRYLSDKLEQRIGRKQFFLRILRVLLVSFTFIGGYYLCFIINFLSGTCPIIHLVELGSQDNEIPYILIISFLSLFFPIAVLIHKRIHDLGYSGNGIFWMFRGFVLWIAFFNSLDVICSLSLGTNYSEAIFSFRNLAFRYLLNDFMAYICIVIFGGIIVMMLYLLFRRGDTVSNNYGEIQ